MDEFPWRNLDHGHDRKPLAARVAFPLRGERDGRATLGTVLAEHPLAAVGAPLHLPIGHPIIPVVPTPFADVDTARNPLGDFFDALAVAHAALRVGRGTGPAVDEEAVIR